MWMLSVLMPAQWALPVWLPVMLWPAACLLAAIGALSVLPPRWPLRRNAHLWAFLPLLGLTLANLYWQASAAMLVSAMIIVLGVCILHFTRRMLQGAINQCRIVCQMALLTLAALQLWQQSHGLGLLLCLALCYALLFMLLGSARDWAAAQLAARHAAWRFLAIIALCATPVLLQISLNGGADLPLLEVRHWPAWALHLASGALVLAVLMISAQWPWHGWLQNGMCAPTPVCAIVHAGLAGAGALFLLHYQTLLGASGWAWPVLAAAALLSLVIASGAGMIQTDLKRRLALSTSAQMGCMLLQCALGAWHAALLHLLLHAVFKANLFLQAGSALQENKAAAPAAQSYVLLALLCAALYWLMPASTPGAALLSAGLLASALLQGVDSASPQAQRAWLLLWAVAGLALWLTLHHWLHALPMSPSHQLPLWLSLALPLLLCAAVCCWQWCSRHPQHRLAQKMYFFLLRQGEARAAFFDAHTGHLLQRAANARRTPFASACPHTGV
ncbi:proton-conducting transporter membrane subunit [Massilia sp. W12]|uniref:proton-conducting transporter transmembrane domain-containing protein n=1 Tax=Massilia sp. W12 TaxID=3126507 RepID=UPI0030D5D6ED